MRLKAWNRIAATEHRSRIKDPRAEAKLFSGRALVALSLVLMAFLALAGRLSYLQVFNHEHFTTLSENNRLKVQPLPPTRGLIFDRNGVLLAENLPSYRLEITPEQVPNMEATLTGLGEMIEIDDADIERFLKLIRRNPRYNGTPLRFRLSEEEVARLAVNLHLFPGVDIRADLTRFYPLNTHASHVIGYVGRIDERELQTIDTAQYRGSSHIGKIGVEKSYEELLRGQVGHQQVEINAEGRVLRILERTAPIPGKNVYISIDSHVQEVAEQALVGHNGAIVAIDPTNGEILALASTPGYDPNLFVNGIDHVTYNALNTSRDRPLFNRALRGTYPPGSTIKPFLGLAGLEYGATNASRAIYCPGYYRLPGLPHKYRDWKRLGHGRTSLDKAITQSCDVYFYTLAHTLGIGRMHDFLSYFSLGRRTGVDLPGEKEGLVPSADWKRAARREPWYAGETLIAGIGQGYMLTTPLQLANATAILSKEGEHFAPRILHATQDQASREIEFEAPRPLPSIPIQDRHNWEFVLASMAHVVQHGTARRIGRDATYQIAGKTGTAQVFTVGQDERYDEKELAKHLLDHALFIAFAPAEDPQIAVAVIVEHGGHGGATAAPLAREVLDAYLVDRQ